MQSTPNSPSSHDCPFRLLQTKMCCWVQVSFSSQIKILCDLHNLFNTDPHSDPSFTFPLFCQQQNISSLKTDLQPRQMIRQPSQKKDKVKDISGPGGGSLKLSLWWKVVKVWQNGLARQKLGRSERKTHAKQNKKGLKKWKLCGQIKAHLIHHLKLHLSGVLLCVSNHV